MIKPNVEKSAYFKVSNRFTDLNSTQITDNYKANDLWESRRAIMPSVQAAALFLQQLIRHYNALSNSHFLFHYESMIRLLKLTGKLIRMIIFSKYRLKIQNKRKRSALPAH